MGYDMSMVERDESMEAEHAQAVADFNQYVKERGTLTPGEEHDAMQAKVSAAHAEMDRTDLNYFRLNIWGMSRAREDMHSLGMLAYEYEKPPWPEPADFGLTQDEWWAYESDEPTTDERLVKMAAANDALLAWSPPDEPGIPIHKLGSNDGWIVTPIDLTGALALYDGAPIDERNKVRDSWVNEETGSCYWDEWIAFLRRAEALAGFRVW